MYYQIIISIPNNHPTTFFIPEESVSPDLLKDMSTFADPPEILNTLPGLIHPDDVCGFLIMPDIKITKIFTFFV